MKKALLIIGMISILISLSAYLTETASLENFLIRSEPNSAYDNWVSHIAEGVAVQNYNLYAPYDIQNNDFGEYRVPNSTELAQWGEIVDLFLLGMLDEAQTAVDNAEFPYQVVEFHDTDSGRTYFMLREVPNDIYYDQNGTTDTYDDEIGAFHYGWGLYIFSPAAQRPIIVTVPHPTDDFPTPIIGYDGFSTWDASYLLISGAGREVRWSNVGNYTNSKSISDPTRTEAHPFNVAYKKFADKIREDFGQREFSFQVHSYDWNRHQGYTDNQISAGNNRLCPNLPIRDLSSMKEDLINKGSHIMIPANTIGIHQDVYLNQYYSVNYSVHDFTFSDGELEYPVNDNIDLPAYSQNRQMLYTLNGWNDYDSFEPFFHIEMDELPNMYEETENNYKWFYGWIEDESKWDYDNLFTFPREYYSLWINDLNELYDDLFTMDDNLIPPVPQNLSVVNNSMQYVTLGWERSDAYDFESYEILYATSPIADGNYEIFDRSNNSLLASQACEEINVTSLSSSSTYYFRIRAKDKNGNYSDLSGEVSSVPAPTNISNFSAHGMTQSVRLAWNTNPPTGFQGFNVYRRTEDTDWEMIDTYETNTYLSSGQYTYEYWDFDTQNNEHYTYRISAVNNSGYESIHNTPMPASPSQVHDLVLTNQAGTLTDSASFSQNFYASDGQDLYWDQTKSGPSSNYVWVSFYEQYWSQNGTYLGREVKGGYDLNEDLKTWVIRIRSDQYNVPLSLSIPTASTRSEKMYIYDNGSGNWHNMQDGAYQFSVSNSGYRTMTLYWGNLQPSVIIGSLANQVLQGGNQVNFSFSPQNPFLIDHMDLYIKNASDSLMVSENMPGTSSLFTYMVPQVLEMPECKVYIRVVSTDGVAKTFASPYTLAIVPRMNLIYNEPGWATKSNPFPQQSFGMEEVFGPQAMGYVWDEEWTSSDSFEFGNAYFVNATDFIFNSSTSDVLRNEMNVNLEPGWNFIANPHMCNYKVSSLRFTVNGNLYRFSEMISQNLISRAVYVYRDSAYVLTEEIKAHESFFIKNYTNSGNEVVLNFYPYFTAPNITPPVPYWAISMRSSLSDNDAITVGSSPIATDGYDFRVDMPSAPEKTLFPSTTLYLDKSADASFPEARLREEFRAFFASSDQEQMAFDFAIEADEAGLLKFAFDKFNFPAEWTARVHFQGIAPHVDELSDAEYLQFNLTEPGIYPGQLIIYNYPVSGEDVVQAPIDKLIAYPNPFNPSVNISFHLPRSQDCRIDIYNIKGQRVTSLHKGLLASGNHSLQWHGKDANGRNVASGIYFARVKTPHQAKSLKIMLMK
jgi:hypothetical protein